MQRRINTYQHCCPQVVFMKELCDKDVNVQHVCDIFFLDISQNVNEPFEALVAGAYPQKVHL